MNEQEQAFVEGFVKRASEYDIDQNTAIEMLKNAGLTDVRLGQPAPKGLKFPVNLGARKGTINELGLHEPHDIGAELAKKMKVDSATAAKLRAIREQYR